MTVTTAPAPTDAGPAVRVRNLTKLYAPAFRRSVCALDGVTLEIPRGLVFGLLGPNGAGKTTLVKILLGIARRTGGEAELLGRPAPDPATRRRVGFLPETPRFAAHLTGLGALALMGSLAGLSRRETLRRAGPLLEEAGLAADAGTRKVSGYSKGMLQRLGLAQALIADPELVILDEPTDGVDPVGRRDIRLLLERLRARGKTVVVSSHILSEIEAVCDRVAVLGGGRLQFEGPVAELTRAEGEWELEVTAPSDALASAIAEHADVVVPRERGYLVRVRDPLAIDRIVDVVRARGAGLRRLVEKRSTLEEKVVALLGRAPAGAPAAPAPASGVQS
jgi:ABC-2 type transport system ATP-binding protein